MKKQVFNPSEIGIVPSPMGRARVGVDCTSSKQSNSPSLEFLSSLSFAKKFFSLHRRDRCVGFTLAEVLITLGVVGVIAAMTMPTLIKNYQKMTWTNQLKKSYSTLEQGFQKMLADEGVDKISDTSIWALKNNTQCSVTNNDFSTNEDCKKFLEGLKKYFKITGVVKYGVQAKWMNNYIPNNASNNLGDTAIRDAIILADGTLISGSTKFLATPETKDCNAIKQLGGHMCSRVATNFDIDINGKKGPNEFGRDIFRFVISDEHGKLYPSGGKDFAIFSKLKSLNNNSTYWQNSINRCGFTDNKDISTIYGHGCAARIMENNWKMDY